MFGCTRKDANGAVDPTDFASAVRRFRVHVSPGVVRALRRSAVRQLVREVDSDGDGVITYDECVARSPITRRMRVRVRAMVRARVRVTFRAIG